MDKRGSEQKGGDQNNEDINNYLKIGLGVLTFIGWVYSMYAGAGDKKMKAPGKPGVFISRNAFEKNPSSYFRDLRKN